MLRFICTYICKYAYSLFVIMAWKYETESYNCCRKLLNLQGWSWNDFIFTKGPLLIMVRQSQITIYVQANLLTSTNSKGLVFTFTPIHDCKSLFAIRYTVLFFKYIYICQILYYWVSTKTFSDVQILLFQDIICIWKMFIC